MFGDNWTREKKKAKTWQSVVIDYVVKYTHDYDNGDADS